MEHSLEYLHEILTKQKSNQWSNETPKVAEDLERM